MMRFKYIILLSIISSIFFGQDISIANEKNTDNQEFAEEAQVERDPFRPFSIESESMASVKNKSGNPFAVIDPVTSFPLNTYIVIGTIVSENKDIAAIRAKNNYDYYVTVGQKIGSEGGTIANITFDNITVSIEEKIVPIMVHNKFEINDETS